MNLTQLLSVNDMTYLDDKLDTLEKIKRRISGEEAFQKQKLISKYENNPSEMFYDQVIWTIEMKVALDRRITRLERVILIHNALIIGSLIYWFGFK